MCLGTLETAESFKVTRLLSNVLIKPGEVGVMPTLSIFKHFFKKLEVHTHPHLRNMSFNTLKILN